MRPSVLFWNSEKGGPPADVGGTMEMQAVYRLTKASMALAVFGKEKTMKTKLFILFIVGFTAVIVCALRARDYTFDVIGTISAEDSMPLKDVEVILEVNRPVYEGVNARTTQRVVTSTGSFIFRCLSHSSSTKYSVTVRKDGFEPQTVCGAAPPNREFKILLRKASTDHSGNREGKNRCMED
jgi:hypothetical protein